MLLSPGEGHLVDHLRFRLRREDTRQITTAWRPHMKILNKKAHVNRGNVCVCVCEFVCVCVCVCFMFTVTRDNENSLLKWEPIHQGNGVTHDKWPPCFLRSHVEIQGCNCQGHLFIFPLLGKPAVLDHSSLVLCKRKEMCERHNIFLSFFSPAYSEA